jgi:hypothetical protein
MRFLIHSPGRESNQYFDKSVRAPAAGAVCRRRPAWPRMPIDGAIVAGAERCRRSLGGDRLE